MEQKQYIVRLKNIYSFLVIVSSKKKKKTTKNYEGM